MVNWPKFPTSEYIALQDLYTSTNGSFWHWFNTSDQSIPWNFTNPTVNPCLDNWQGITCSCSIVVCSVSMLILESHNLIGRFDSRWVVGIVYFSIFIVHVIIMSIADFSYVYIVITYDTYISSITAFFLAFFRIITNNLLLSKALPRVTIFYSNRGKFLKISKHSMQLLKNHQYSNQDISFLELLISFNNIVIPIFAVICILPDCFYNALFSSNSIQTSYTLQTCNGYVTNDESTGITDPFYFCNPVIQEVSYVPPFIYSYQCSSKIIINYVPVYTVMFLFVSLLSPLFHILCHIWYNAYILPSKDTLTWYQRMIMKWMISNHIKELQIPQNHYHYHSTTQMNQQSDHTINNNNNNDDNTIIISVTSLPVEFKIFSKLTLTVNIHSYLAIILSFGILFPPLAFIGYISIYILTIYEESNVARVLLRAITIGNYSYVEGVGKEFDGVEGSMSLTLWSTLFVCCGLYAYIIFDTIGDAIGWLASLPLALVMFFLPFTLWFIKAILRSWSRQHDEREVSMSHTQTVEKERSISSIQMISRPTNVISACSVENPILINSSHDPSLPSQV